MALIAALLSLSVSAFSDVTKKDSAGPETRSYAAVTGAYGKGLMVGVGDNTFSPDTEMTRAMFVTVLYRMEGCPDTDMTSPFDDIKYDWYIPAVCWAYENGIVNGTSDVTFAPDGSITREDIAVILWRYAGSPELSADLSAYTDASFIDGYAANAMRWAVEVGMMTGYGDGTIRPRDPATRAEVATLFMRFDALFGESFSWSESGHDDYTGVCLIGGVNWSYYTAYGVSAFKLYDSGGETHTDRDGFWADYDTLTLSRADDAFKFYISKTDCGTYTIRSVLTGEYITWSEDGITFAEEAGEGCEWYITYDEACSSDLIKSAVSGEYLAYSTRDGVIECGSFTYADFVTLMVSSQIYTQN